MPTETSTTDYISLFKIDWGMYWACKSLESVSQERDPVYLDVKTDVHMSQLLH